MPDFNRRCKVKKGLCMLMVLGLALSFTLTGCGPKKAESSSAAIETAKTMQTTQERVDYLVSQAKAFYNSKDFQEAIDIAQYVLSALDKDSQAAKDLLEKAKKALTEAAEGAVEDVKNKVMDRRCIMPISRVRSARRMEKEKKSKTGIIKPNISMGGLK